MEWSGLLDATLNWWLTDVPQANLRCYIGSTPFPFCADIEPSPFRQPDEDVDDEHSCRDHLAVCLHAAFDSGADESRERVLLQHDLSVLAGVSVKRQRTLDR